jgi:hypothetical protein
MALTTVQAVRQTDTLAGRPVLCAGDPLERTSLNCCDHSEPAARRDDHQRPGGAALAGWSSAGSEEVRQALARIVKDGHRAGDVLGRIRALIHKTPPQRAIALH